MNTTTIANSRSTDRHVGIDVGKAMLDIAIYEVDFYLQEHNCPEGNGSGEVSFASRTR